MVTRTDPSATLSLRSVTVRPIRGLEERCRWDALMAAHHYLPYRGLFGRALRQVAEWDGEWVALLGWQAGVLKLSARDRWIGWLPAQQYRRLHLIANNTRFLILPGAQVPNLASRVLGLSLRRLSDDWRALRGHPALLAETFVDPSRYAGTCYRAANWRSVGFTGGYARRSGPAPQWDYHGQPKEIFMYELTPDAAARLCRLDEEAEWREHGPKQALDTSQIRSLYDHLRTVEDYRDARGRRYQLATVLCMAVAARLAGYRGAVPLAEFAQNLSQDTLAALHSHYNKRLGRYTAPQKSTFHAVLARLPAENLDRALRDWARRLAGGAGGGVAMDGKCVRGAARQLPKAQCPVLISAVVHNTGVVIGQESVTEKSNEIPAVRQLIDGLDLRGMVVTLDALHTQCKTALAIILKGADYVMSVKYNQKTMREDLGAINWNKPEVRATACRTLDKGHGRVETRECRCVDLQGAQWDDFVKLPHRRQAVRCVRERYEVKTGKTSIETVYAVTSLSPQQATCERLMALLRGHWTIENRLHHVRDVSYDEDRCRAHKGQLPQNLASLSNAAISIVRHQARFDTLPPANRYYAGHPDEALAAVLRPLTI